MERDGKFTAVPGKQDLADALAAAMQDALSATPQHLHRESSFLCDVPPQCQFTQGTVFQGGFEFVASVC